MAEVSHSGKWRRRRMSRMEKEDRSVHVEEMGEVMKGEFADGLESDEKDCAHILHI